MEGKKLEADQEEEVGRKRGRTKREREESRGEEDMCPAILLIKFT